jgi:hypothetical protein
MSLPVCQHIKSNGLLCRSFALSGQRYCYFHRQQHDFRRHPSAKPPIFELPPLEDANSIQLAVMEVCRALLEDRIDQRRAGLLLYALQIASSNLRRVDFEPLELAEAKPAPVSVAAPRAQAENFALRYLRQHGISPRKMAAEVNDALSRAQANTDPSLRSG